MRAKLFPLLLGFAALALVAGVAYHFSVGFFVSGTPTRTEDYHAWIHSQLSLTPAQERLLQPSERRYEEARRHLEEVIRLANEELARSIAEDKGHSPRVEKAVEEIHTAMGELQRATLRHIFEMKDALSPAQYDRLMELTVDGLSDNARRH
ncbi:MAG: periplasmic heavy metal sensor [Terrimicrobiaceae bacterium]